MNAGPNIVKDGLVYAVDAGSELSFRGEGTTNYWATNRTYTYTNNSTMTRNSTDIDPVFPGYEVVKIVSNNGGYSQAIPYTAAYQTTAVSTITNSVYAYLVSGDYVQVGQHWYPWYYGVPEYIEKNKWVRISQTYTINEGNSYNNAGLAWSTNGTAYFCCPQYEWKSYMTPWTYGTRGDSVSSGGGVKDLKGGYNGTLYGGTSFTYSNQGAWSFAGGDDYISTPVTRGDLGNNMSVEAFFKWNGSSGDAYQPIIGGVETNTEFFIGKNSGNTNFGIQDGNYNGSFVTTNYVFDGGWHHMVYTYSGGTGRLYLDGVLRGTGSFSKCNDAEVIAIGRESEGGGYWWKGNIGTVRFYTKALSSTEVLRNFNSQKSRYGL